MPVPSEVGTIAPGCAHLLRICQAGRTMRLVRGADGRGTSAEIEGWGYFADALGMLHPCCPGCLADRFGITAQLRLRRIT